MVAHLRSKGCCDVVLSLFNMYIGTFFYFRDNRMENNGCIEFNSFLPAGNLVGEALLLLLRLLPPLLRFSSRQCLQ